MEKSFKIYIESLSSNSQKAFTLCDSKVFGEKKQGKVVFSAYEVFFLLENYNAQAIYKDKEISISEAQGLLFKRCKDFFTGYPVFRELRRKGYIVKSGLKFGSEFRVYCSKLDAHAKWLCFPIKDAQKVSWEELVAKNRVAHAAGKNLLVGVVDLDEDVSFYEMRWIKP